jgi:hypothetical protein
VQPVRLLFGTITNRVRRNPVWAGVLAAAVLIVLLLIREDKRANIEADMEARREQDAVMDAYLSQIANLLLHEELEQPTSEGKRAQQVARGQTLTALRRIDGGRKGTVIGFLSDSDLIAVVDLYEADLSGANLNLANLSGADDSWARRSGGVARTPVGKLMGCWNFRTARRV